MPTPARTTKPSAKVVQFRRPTTIEMVKLCTPDSAKAQRVSESFGLPLVNSEEIYEIHHQLVVQTAKALAQILNERAMKIHFQRLVGTYVASAYGAGQFYSRTVTEARAATAKLHNDDRDEDRDGPVGFDSSPNRKREFAAQIALQAHAQRMAAEGAADAYKQVIGETWQPFERNAEIAPPTTERKAATLQLQAFD